MFIYFFFILFIYLFFVLFLIFLFLHFVFCFFVLVTTKETNPEAKNIMINMVHILPTSNRVLLIELLKFLQRVTQHSKDNFMTPQNLGIVFEVIALSFVYFYCFVFVFLFCFVFLLCVLFYFDFLFQFLFISQIYCERNIEQQ
jgi:hypothetical protein